MCWAVTYDRSKRLKPIIVDTGLYLLEKHEIFYATQKRELPNAFRLFSGMCFISDFFLFSFLVLPALHFSNADQVKMMLLNIGANVKCMSIVYILD